MRLTVFPGVPVGLGLAVLVAGCDRKPAPPPADSVEVQLIAHFDLDSTRTIEVIGLRRWTVEMIRDSLRKYSPNEGLESDASPANLRNLLGFADAAAFSSSVVFDEDEKTMTTIAVREPQDSAIVRYAPQSLDTVARIAEWRPITAPITADTTVQLLYDVASAHFDGPSRLVVDSTVRGRNITHREGFAFESAADSLVAKPVLDQIAARKSEADFATAVRTIDVSTSLPDRIAAVLILANFPTRDLAWRTLLEAAVGREQALDASLAAHALTAFSERFPRTVDWAPVSPTIRNVLNGTAIFALPSLASALAASGASPSQAKAYLAGGGEMLTAFLETDNPELSGPVHRLLIALRGEDLGLEPAPWRQWIATLQPLKSDSAR